VKDLKEMEAQHIQPDTYTYAAIIDAYAKKGDIDMMMKYFDIMERANLPKDKMVYGSLLYPLHTVCNMVTAKICIW
jgi:pentatricopeptide repeat protein